MPKNYKHAHTVKSESNNDIAHAKTSNNIVINSQSNIIIKHITMSNN